MTNQPSDDAARIAAALEALEKRLDELERDILELIRTNAARIGEAWRYGD